MEAPVSGIHPITKISWVTILHELHTSHMMKNFF